MKTLDADCLRFKSGDCFKCGSEIAESDYSDITSEQKEAVSYFVGNRVICNDCTKKLINYLEEMTDYFLHYLEYKDDGEKKLHLPCVFKKNKKTWKKKPRNHGLR